MEYIRKYKIVRANWDTKWDMNLCENPNGNIYGNLYDILYRVLYVETYELLLYEIPHRNNIFLMVFLMQS